MNVLYYNEAIVGTAPRVSHLTTDDDLKLRVVASSAPGNPVQTTSALEAGENFIGTVGGVTLVPTSTLTLPVGTATYTSGDLVANSATAAEVVLPSITVGRIAGGSGMIRRCKLSINEAANPTLAVFRIHFFAATGIPTNGDDGAFVFPKAVGWLGSMDVTCSQVFSDGKEGFGVPVTGSEINFNLASGQDIYWAVEAKAAYPRAANTVLTLTVEEIAN